MADRPLRLFYSYSHLDRRWLDTVRAKFKPLVDAGYIQEWHDERIAPGEDWSKAIKTQMESADVIAFLVTQNFCKSAGCAKEIACASELLRDFGLLLFPILLTPCAYKAIKCIGKIQPSPGWNRPLETVHNPDLAVVAAQLEAAVERIAPSPGRSGTGELLNLLPYLCDRGAQAAPFNARRKPPRLTLVRATPLLVIAHGSDRESHEGFLLRFHKRLLPDYVSRKEVPIITQKLEWPWEGGPAVHEWLAEALLTYDHPGKITLLHTSVDFCDWRAETYLSDIVAFWERTDLAIRSEHLIHVVFVKYRCAAGQSVHPAEARLRAAVDRLSARPLTCGIVLKEFLPVPRGEADEWPDIVREEGMCSDAEKPSLCDEIVTFYGDALELPMNQLAPKLKSLISEPVPLKKAV